MEIHARYGEYIYAHSDDTLWVNQFISSEFHWEEKRIRLIQKSQLPREGKVRLEISCDEPQEFTLLIRRPHWAKHKLKVLVNESNQTIQNGPSSYISIKRIWQNGDVVELVSLLALRLEAMPDNPARVAIFYGPVLLAGRLEEDSDAMGPVLVTNNRPVEEWLTRLTDDDVRFRTENAGRPADQTLVPLHEIDDGHYVAYWELLSEAEWEQHRKDCESEAQRQLELECRTIDLFSPGEMQSAQDHKVKGEGTSAGEFGGRKFRHAYNGGWFSCEIVIPDDQPADLIVTYWGSETGNRNFDLFLDGKQFASESLHEDRPEKFWEKTYMLPSELTEGKSKAILRFQAHPENFAGGVYGLRVVKRPE